MLLKWIPLGDTTLQVYEPSTGFGSLPHLRPLAEADVIRTRVMQEGRVGVIKH